MSATRPCYGCGAELAATPGNHYCPACIAAQLAENGGLSEREAFDQYHDFADRCARAPDRFTINPDPIEVVPQARRDVWTRQAGWRCYHEDGRGRCTSRETKPWEMFPGRVEWYCERHEETL